MGFFVVNTNLYKNSPGFSYADIGIVADILDKEKNLEIAKKYNIDAVISDQTDIAVNTVAYITEKLNLMGVGTDIAELFTNKYLMRKHININELYHPKYKICNSIKEIKDFFLKLNESIIIKPLNSQSSRGISIVNEIFSVESAYIKALEFSSDDRVLVEEYIDGIELTVEGFKKYKGDHITLAISKKQHYNNKPFIAKELIYSNEVLDFDIQKLIEINNEIFKNVPFGITHVEYKYKDGNFYLIEAAIRGGGTKISSHIVPLLTGIDIYKILIETVLFSKTENFNFDIKNTNKVAMLGFFDFSSGKVKRINGIDFLKNNRNILDFEIELNEGEIIKIPEDDRSRVGYFIVYEEKLNKLRNIVDQIRKEVYVEYI
ncbi:hypothetical protein C3L23_08585 [Nautilia sp. PV-1]|uniref:ATP-grasp domain-containing protein n=1 Tax=Nautilia sp. PV-1 TaxID=2579250 RepID=UPI000FD8EB6E|nr:ATP-grasp domain-containing protein [Nautilia sp. PV-1]AZV47326.1 hypothetical protein C3L23_08585 [Nautilia sp. PV-1]